MGVPKRGSLLWKEKGGCVFFFVRLLAAICQLMPAEQADERSVSLVQTGHRPLSEQPDVNGPTAS